MIDCIDEYVGCSLQVCGRQGRFKNTATGGNAALELRYSQALQNMSSSIVYVFVVSLDTRSERRFDLHITVEQLKVPAFSHHTHPWPIHTSFTDKT